MQLLHASDLSRCPCSPSFFALQTEVIGRGKADMGLKAMIHTLAAKGMRGYPVTSVGTLMDEPATGIIYIDGSGITPDFQSLRGKRIGYVGEFGKIQIDE